MSGEELLAPGTRVWHSPRESERFGFSLSRLTIGPGAVEPAGLLQAIEALDSEIVVVRFDASRSELPGLLARGRRVCLAAGALTYWEKALDGRISDPRVVTGVGLDPVLVRDLVRSSFAGYANHYTINPLLDGADALEGYEEWALTSLAADPTSVLVLTVGGTPLGVATLKISDNEAEILLAGLVPKAQGRRLYDVLLAGCEHRAAVAGATRLIISTQVHNVRVQRAWARNGLRPFGALETVHLVNRDLLTSS